MRVLTDEELELVAGGNTVSTVTVTALGYRDIGWWEQSWYTYEGSGGDGGGGGEPSEEEPPTDSPGVVNAVDPSSPDYARAQAAAENLKENIDRLDPIIDAIPDNQIFTLPNGDTITGAEIKEIWENINFQITNETYGPGYGGENLGSTVEVHFTTVEGYSAHGEGGMNYLILHEIGHSTPEGVQSNRDSWLDYIARGGVPGDYHNSPEFSENERRANDIAKALGGGLGEGVMTNPPHGYSPPSTGGGSGGTGGGSGGGGTGGGGSSGGGGTGGGTGGGGAGGGGSGGGGGGRGDTEIF